MRVSAVSLGSWKTYGGGGISDERNVAAAIVGASRPEQVRENAEAADVDLDEETISHVEAIFG